MVILVGTQILNTATVIAVSDRSSAIEQGRNISRRVLVELWGVPVDQAAMLNQE